MSLAMLRYRWGSFLGTFAALLLGVAVLSGCLSLWAAARPQVPAALAAMPVVVAAPRYDPPDGGFPTYRPWSSAETDGLLARLAAVPGVAAVVPDRPFYVQRVVDGRAVGDRRDSLHSGRSWASAGALLDGVAPQRAGEVVVDAGLGVPVGAALPVLTAAGPATWTVTGTVTGAAGKTSGTGTRAAGAPSF
jgi:putative ABC transport system permease protein